MDPKEFSKQQHERDGYLQEYNKRKRLCMNLIDGVLEGYPKSKQKLIEDTEIETDEAAGFNINQYKWTILNSHEVVRAVKKQDEQGRKWNDVSGGNKIEAISSDW